MIKQRSFGELLDTEEPAWPLVQSWAGQATTRGSHAAAEGQRWSVSFACRGHYEKPTRNSPVHFQG
jgi:hypothetical protein